MKAKANVFMKLFSMLLAVSIIALMLPADIFANTDSNGSIALQPYASVTPSNGEAGVINVGELLFTDRSNHKFSADIPIYLKGAGYIRSSLVAGISAEVKKAGWVYIITPGDAYSSEVGFNQVNTLINAGFEVIDTLAAGVLATTVTETITILGKEVQVGDKVSCGSWGILLAHLYGTPEPEPPKYDVWDTTTVEPTGDGSSADAPIMIETPEQFAYVIKNGGGDGLFYQLEKDIYLNDIDKINWQTGEVDSSYTLRTWYTAAGTEDFKGTIDGNGHTVYGMYLNAKPSSYSTGYDVSSGTGLIPTAAGGNFTVKNLGIDNAYLNYGSNTGGLVGTVAGTVPVIKVQNCFVGDDVSVTGANAAAFVSMTIHTGSAADQGVIEISNCFSRANLAKKAGATGLIGTTWVNSSTITIKNCYNSAGAIATMKPINSSNNYALEGSGDSNNATLISADNMKGEDVLTSDSKMNLLGSAYTAQGTDKFPELRVFAPVIEEEKLDIWDGPSATSEPTKGGDGSSAEKAILIETPEQFAWVFQNGGAGKYYKLANDIYLNDISKISWTDGTTTDYTPNVWKSATTMNATIDGDGHVVHGLYISNAIGSGNAVDGLKGNGLISSLVNGVVTITGLGIDDSYVAGTHAAAFVGHIGSNGWGVASNATLTIDSCYVGSNVKINGFNAGAFIGTALYNASGLDVVNITNCYNRGTLEGTGSNGLYAGDMWTYARTQVSVSNSYNATGPICTLGQTITVSNSYALEGSGDKTGTSLRTTENMQGTDVLILTSKMLRLGIGWTEMGEGNYPVPWIFSGKEKPENLVPPEDKALEKPEIIFNPADKLAEHPEYQDYLDGSRLWQGIPSMAKDNESGRLWYTFYSGGTGEGEDNFTLVYSSDDDGVTWGTPALVIDPEHPVRSYDPNLWTDPNGRLWLFWAQSFFHHDGRCGVWAMYTDNPEDENPTWSEPERIANGIAMCDPMVLDKPAGDLPAGTWLLPTAIWASSTVEELAYERHPNCYVSYDEGMTWEYLSSVPSTQYSRSCDENMIVQNSDGTLSMYVRTTGGIEVSTSQDGLVWTPSTLANISNVDTRFWFGTLEDGVLLAVINDPPDGSKTRSHMTAALSYDDGKTWPHKLVIDARSGTSYPDAHIDSDGNIYVAYDCGRSSKGEMTMAKITAADIVAGEIITETSKVKVLVNNNSEWSEPFNVSIEKNLAILESSYELCTLSSNSKIFSDRTTHYACRTLPPQMVGMGYLMGSLDNGVDFTAVKGGWVYVLTPAVGVASQTAYLEGNGFTKQTTLPVGQFSTTLNEKLDLMQKQVSAGESITISRWSIVLAAPPLKGDINDDGNIDICDLVMLDRAVRGDGVATSDATDLNVSGITNARDLGWLRKFLLSWIAPI